MRFPILAAGLLLASCSTAQVQQAVTIAQEAAGAVTDACKDYALVAAAAQTQVKGGALNTANSLISYGNSVCATAQTIASAASNPGTAAWVGQITGMISAIAKPAAPAPAA